MKRDETNRPLVLVYALIVVLLLFTVTAYYVSNQSYEFRETPLIGDAVCGNLPTSSGQDTCCAKAHEDEVTIQCVGSWRYIEGIRECQFVCRDTLPICPEDTKKCSDGNNVIRNPSDECKFWYCE